MAESLTVAYRHFGLGGSRPYLVLDIAGINAWSGPVVGLLDSGADRTVLPAGYAPLMGYTAADLEATQGTQVGGSLTLRSAKTPARAYVPEIPELVFEISPFFVQGCQTALWGRADVMRQFDITIMECAQLFSLTRSTGLVSRSSAATFARGFARPS